MISINDKCIDLVIQLEEHADIDSVFNLLSLEINEVLIICPELFLQRFVQATYEDMEEDEVHILENKIETKVSYLSYKVLYKNKFFKFHFIVLQSETVVINNPFKGEQIFNIGLNEIKI